MAISFHLDGAAHYGAGPGDPLGYRLNTSLGGTATVGDLLIMLATGGVDGSGLSNISVYDNLGSSGWTLLFDLDDIPGDGYWDFRQHIYWKICSGGETSVTVDWPDSSNKAMELLWISEPGALNEVYMMVQGGGAWNGAKNRSEEDATGLISKDGESYIGFASSGRDDVNNDAECFLTVNNSSSSDGNQFNVAGGTAGARMAYWNGTAHSAVAADSLLMVVHGGIHNVNFGVLGVRGPDPHASLVVASIDSNRDLRFAGTPGTTLTFVDPGAPSASLSVDSSDTANIVVYLATDADGYISSTANDVRTALNTDGHITVTRPVTSDGTTKVIPLKVTL